MKRQPINKGRHIQRKSKCGKSAMTVRGLGWCTFLMKFAVGIQPSNGNARTRANRNPLPLGLARHPARRDKRPKREDHREKYAKRYLMSTEHHHLRGP